MERDGKRLSRGVTGVLICPAELEWPQTSGEAVLRGKAEILRDREDSTIGAITGNVRRFEGTGENRRVGMPRNRQDQTTGT
jgi:hypothetical protein